MNRIWWQILAVMVVGSIVKYQLSDKLAWVVIDLVVLLVGYLILRRNPFVNLKRSMTFLGGLTLISILADLGILGPVAGNLVLFILLGWMLFGDKFSNYPKFRRKYRK